MVKALQSEGQHLRNNCLSVQVKVQHSAYASRAIQLGAKRAFVRSRVMVQPASYAPSLGSNPDGAERIAWLN